MSSKSLRKRKKAHNSQDVEKVSKHHHLVAGEHKHKHNHTHSITPISADEVQKLNDIDPALVPRLFDIIENSLEAEKEETTKFYESVEREQRNDELALKTKSKDNTKSMLFAFVTIIILLTVGSVLIYNNHIMIGGAMITTVLLGIVKAILGKSDKKNKEEESNE